MMRLLNSAWAVVKADKGVTIEEQGKDWLEDNPLSDRRPELALAEAGCPAGLLALAERCWADVPRERPTFEQCAEALRRQRQAFPDEERKEREKAVREEAVREPHRTRTHLLSLPTALATWSPTANAGR